MGGDQPLHELTTIKNTTPMKTIVPATDNYRKWSLRCNAAIVTGNMVESKDKDNHIEALLQKGLC